MLKLRGNGKMIKKIIWLVGVLVLVGLVQARTIRVYDCVGLQAMENNLSDNYVLHNSINCSDTVNWNGDEGFMPVGSLYNNAFTGTFDGRNFTIYNLTSNFPRASGSYVGLFGYTLGADIRNVKMENVELYGNDNLGGIAGVARTTNITNVAVTGMLWNSDDTIGGIVGRLWDNSYLTDAYTDVYMILGDDNVGGIVGSSSSPINNTYSNATILVTSPTDKYIGGIAGRTYNLTRYTPEMEIQVGSINNSFANLTLVNDAGELKGNICGYDYSGVFNVYFNNHSDNPDNCVYWDEPECTAIQDDSSYFYDVSNPPMDNWDFVGTWSTVWDGIKFPPLKMDENKHIKITVRKVLPNGKIKYKVRKMIPDGKRFYKKRVVINDKYWKNMTTTRLFNPFA